jgi:hypothetical protein
MGNGEDWNTGKISTLGLQRHYCAIRVTITYMSQQQKMDILGFNILRHELFQI